MKVNIFVMDDCSAVVLIVIHMCLQMLVSIYIQ